jgi:hypothetical protein
MSAALGRNGGVGYWNCPNTQPASPREQVTLRLPTIGQFLACPPGPIRVPCLGSRREAGGTPPAGPDDEGPPVVTILAVVAAPLGA